MTMRVLRAILLLFLALPLFAQTGQKSIVVEDMNKSADPCNDFFNYSNGAWRAANPIPPSMQRWSRRWQTGEQNKEALKVILDDVSQKKDWPRGSVEQLIGDFYGACMDEATVNRLGAKPIQSWTKQIDAMKSTADVQKMIRRLHDAGIPAPFGMSGRPDNHEPTQTIANLYASGIGLPNRDYYFKTEERFQQARAKYKEYI